MGVQKLKRVGETEWQFAWPRAFWNEYSAIEEAVALHASGEGAGAERIVRGVLERVPEHLDAMWQLAGFLRDCGRVAQAEELLRNAVELGRTAFPPRAFRFGRDRLEWGWMENRPFLRCLASWMQAREEAGARGDALDCARELLALNPNDNQGIRCVAVTWLLQSGGDEEAAALAKRYPEDSLPETTYGRALALFRLRRFDEADDVLREAIADLPLVATEMLKAKHRVPRRPYPGMVTVGGADQAYDYWKSAGALWSATPDASEWLRRVQTNVEAAKEDEPPVGGR